MKVDKNLNYIILLIKDFCTLFTLQIATSGEDSADFTGLEKRLITKIQFDPKIVDNFVVSSNVI